jgi:uncharacterized membrane protein
MIEHPTQALFTSFFFTALIFLSIDAVWLSYAGKYFYEPNIGLLLRDEPILWAAALFYLLYPMGVSILIIKPALNKNPTGQVFWNGLILGSMAYGTYNLTNMAVLTGWSVYVVFVDIVWGGILTGTSSALGLKLTKKVFKIL